MFYDDSVYPPALPLDDARLTGKDLGHETKANYVKKVWYPSCACACVFCQYVCADPMSAWGVYFTPP
jgi:hypothetical protein